LFKDFITTKTAAGEIFTLFFHCSTYGLIRALSLMQICGTKARLFSQFSN